MSGAIVTLLYLAFAVMVTASIWLLYATWQVGWRWTAASIVFMGLPLTVFCVRHWRLARWPLALVGVAWLLGIAGLAAAGDLVEDRHPDEPGRSFVERVFGCSGSRLRQDVFAADERSLERYLDGFPMARAPLGSELDLGRAAVHAAALAYLAPDAVRAQTGRWGLGTERVATHAAGNQFALVLARDDALFVAFRGTDDGEDWLDNVDFIPAATPWGRVHQGFLEALDGLWPSLSASIARMRAKNRPIWLTGHSLGGALAVLAAARLEQQGTPVAGVVTFGQPPAGYGDFAKTFARRSRAPLVRYVNSVDAVVEATAPFIMTRLAHAGEERYFDTAGRLHRGQPEMLQTMRDSVCANVLESSAQFSAHAVRRYVVLLDRAAAPSR